MKKLLSSIKWKYYVGYLVITAVLLITGILSAANALPSSTLYLLEEITIALILALSLSVVVGFLGELSLGHAGFMCVGAYLGGKFSAVLCEKLSVSDNNFLVFVLSLIVGGLCAAVFGFVIGLPALRLKGDYLAIVTLAFGEIIRNVFLNTSSESFGGALGLATPRMNKNIVFVFGFLLVLATLAVVQNLIRSKHGRAITAIRDNEIAAKATGIDVTKYKLLVFIISSALAGIAGVLYSYTKATVRSEIFDYNYSIEILVMVVIGGMGNINGTLISAAVITYLNNKLMAVLTGNLAVLQNLVYALILIGIIIYNNAPALKNVREKYNLRTLWAKITKPKKDPAKETDDTGRWDVVPTKIEMDEVLTVGIKKKDGEDCEEKGEGKNE